jgi:hypothetical protein
MDLWAEETLEWESDPHWDLGLGLDAAATVAAESSLPDCWDSVDPDTSLSALNQSQGREEEEEPVVVVKQACKQGATRRRQRRPRLLGARAPSRVVRRRPQCKEQRPPLSVVMTPPISSRPAARPPPPQTTVMTSTRVPDAPAWPGIYVIGATGRLRMLTPSPTYPLSKK